MKLTQLVPNPIKNAARTFLDKQGYRLLRISDADRRYSMGPFDPTTPLPATAEAQLNSANPRLQDLEARYEKLNLPCRVHSQWRQSYLEQQLNLKYFRGDNVYTWQYRNTDSTLQKLRFYAFANYVRQIDSHHLLDRLTEDGQFGCFKYEFSGFNPVSRDVLDSIVEISFLDRHLGIIKQQNLKVLDIGAGYGRLAHRMSEAVPGLTEYHCVDAIPASTFLSEYYLNFRKRIPPARIVPLDQFEQSLQPGQIDLAVNIHSFSECTYSAIAWWLQRVRDLDIRHLMIIPNDPKSFRSTERAGQEKVDFEPLIKKLGYVQKACEPVLADDTVRELVGVHDHMFLFELKP